MGYQNTLIFSLFHKPAGRSPADMGKGLKGIRNATKLISDNKKKA